jgi:hypothetical protein
MQKRFFYIIYYLMMNCFVEKKTENSIIFHNSRKKAVKIVLKGAFAQSTSLINFHMHPEHIHYVVRLSL